MTDESPPSIQPSAPRRDPSDSPTTGPSPSTPRPTEAETGAAALPAAEKPGWRKRMRAWCKRQLVRLAWIALWILVGMTLGWLLWARPMQKQYARLRADYRQVHDELAQTKAELGQARGRITTLEEALAAAQQQGHIARLWWRYTEARAAAQAALRALADGQKTTARTHLVVAQRALADLAAEATDPALQQAANDLAEDVNQLLEQVDTASASASARRVEKDIIPALDALERLLPVRP